MTAETTPQRSSEPVEPINPVKQIESLYARLEKARSIFAAGKVHPILGIDDHYAVESSKGDGFYSINAVCTCQDAQHRTEVHHGWCCHKLAVEIYKEQKVLAQSPKVAKATTKANNSNGSSTTDPDLERKIAELYH